LQPKTTGPTSVDDAFSKLVNLDAIVGGGTYGNNGANVSPGRTCDQIAEVDAQSVVD